jgi:hypothetical protein
MKSLFVLTGILAVSAIVQPASAATVITDEGASAFQGTWNLPSSGLVDIVNPLANPDQVNTSQWTISTSGGGSTGTFATTNNNGEVWTKVFDHSDESSGTGPWGSGTSKVCCGGVPAMVSMVSSTLSYSFQGYELTLSNDSPNRDPKSWTFQGTTNGGATWTTLDTETNQFTSGPPRNETFLYMLSSPTSFYDGFRFNFTDSQDGSSFALAEIEVFGVQAPEPSSMVALCGLAATGLIVLIRRRRTA